MSGLLDHAFLFPWSDLPDEVHDEIQQPDIKFLFEETMKVKMGLFLSVLSCPQQMPLCNRVQPYAFCAGWRDVSCVTVYV